ncbi:MAG: FG-GAP-like repeat-containing protein [Acidimicrobiales bacterium]
MSPAPPTPRRARRRPGPLVVALALALVAAAAGLVGAGPAGATDATEWFKPGVPHSYSYADPSLAAFGPMTWAYATNTGGSDLPAMWSADGRRYVARVEGAGSDAYVDDAAGYANDAFPNVPWGVNSDACNASESGCDPKEMWAPSVAFIGTHWVSFHAVRVSPVSASLPFGRFCIFAATSTSPMGPFKAASSSPIVCPSASTDPAGAVDPDAFVDEETGNAYLVWQTQGNSNGYLQRFWSRRLNSAGTGFASGSTAHTLLVNQAGSWEGTTIENPSLTYAYGAYVLMYSGNAWRTTRYATGYAVCSGPSGPCNRPSSSPLMATTAGSYGPGGADGLVDQRGRFVAMYHSWTQGSGDLGRRAPHVAELKVTGTGLSARVSVIRRNLDGGAGGDALWSFRSGLAYDRSTPTIGGTYTPAVGDFDGDGHDDVYWYGTWDATDAVWRGTATPGRFSSAAADQAGAFLPVAGDFDGDGKGDLFWYEPGTDPRVASTRTSGGNYEPEARPDQLWLSTSTGPGSIRFSSTDRGVTAAAIPLAGDFDGDGTTDIIWFQPGDGADVMWRFVDGVPTSIPLKIVGSYRPVVGDFDGNGTDDLFWYGPGAKADYIWWYAKGGSYTSVPTTVTKKDYRPFAIDADGDGADELFWYTPGPGPDYLWTSLTRGGTPTSRTMDASGVATPVVGDFDGNGDEDVLWYS